MTIPVTILGNQSMGFTDAILAANLLKQRSVRLIPIGVESDVDMNFLSDIGSSPSLLGLTYLHFQTYNDLYNDVYKQKQLLSSICDTSFFSGKKLRKF